MQENSEMTFQQRPKMILKPTGGSFVIILTLDTWLVIKVDYESESTWISNFAWENLRQLEQWCSHFGLMVLRHDNITWSISQKIYVFWLDFFIGICSQFMLQIKQCGIRDLGINVPMLIFWLHHAMPMIQEFTWYRVLQNLIAIRIHCIISILHT